MRTPNIVNMKFGSHLYGLATPTSDVDYKGVFIPTLEELLLNNYPHAVETSTGSATGKNTAQDIDTGLYSLSRFIRHACQGETFAIDMVHCVEPLITSVYWEEIVANRTRFYSRDLKAYMGYVRQQASKYGLKGSRLADLSSAIDSLKQLDPALLIRDAQQNLYFGDHVTWKVKENPHAGQTNQFYMVLGKMFQDTNTVGYTLNNLTKMYDGYGHRAKLAETNSGVDHKAVSHALRAGYQARDIFLKGDFEYPLAETEFILAVKQGNLHYKREVEPVLEKLVEEVDRLADASDLPKTVDTEYWDRWLLSVYQREFNLSI